MKRITEGFKNKFALCLAAVLGFGCASITMAENDIKVYVNGNKVDCEAILKDDKTYIPLRAVSEAMGAEVSWDSERNAAYVSFSEDESTPKLIKDVSESVVAIVGNYKSEYMSSDARKYNERTAHGAGVIIKSGGIILTNAHVVNEIENITVILQDGSSYAGNVQYMDVLSDLAVVKINKLGLKPITMGKKEDITVGKTVVAIGTPISLTLRNSATRGMISGSGVDVGSYYRLIQTDAAINPGNSGGPLINTKGELLGINSSKYASVSIEGMAFAIPVDTVEYVLSQFEKYGCVKRPTLEFELEESWEARIGLPTSKGLTVKNSKSTSLHNNDVITKVNGIEVHSIIDWNEAIKNTYDGGSLTVEYVSGSEIKTIAM
ncbi:MAG: trypsin-like peptidase domain-containing protein [Clostridia bacterium]|nr:trypsin-like peptidase domain-containing protein [Clostridia bacterium]